MKKLLIIFAIILLIASMSTGEMLKCDFVTYDDDGYNCKMTSRFEEAVEVTSVFGTHKVGKANNDVETIYVPSATNTSYIPTKICSHFKNLKKIDLYSKTLKEFNKNIFDGCTKLETVHIRYINVLTLEEDIFANIPELKDVYFHQTSLENLPRNLFKNNPKIEKINFNTNKLKTIEFEPTPEQRSNLKKFSFLENECIKIGFNGDEDFRTTTLQRVIDEIKEKCQTNSAPTSAPLEETPDEQRLVLLERRIDSLDEFKKTLGDLIQQNLQKTSEEVSNIELKYQVLKINATAMKNYLSDLNTETTNIIKNHDTLNGRMNKVGDKVKQQEERIIEISKMKDENKELRSEIDHNKNILIAIVCIQILTVGFALFITFYLKLYSKADKGDSNATMAYNAH